MLVHFAPASSMIVAMLVACFVMVLAFEGQTGFMIRQMQSRR